LIDVSQPAESHDTADDDGNESTSLANVATPTLPPVESTDMLIDVEPELDEDFPHLRRMPGRLFRARTLRSPPPPVVDASSSHHTIGDSSRSRQNTRTQGDLIPGALRSGPSFGGAPINLDPPTSADIVSNGAAMREWLVAQGLTAELAEDTAKIYQVIRHLMVNATRAGGVIDARLRRMSNRTQRLDDAQDRLSDLMDSMQARTGSGAIGAASPETVSSTLHALTGEIHMIEPAIRDILVAFGMTMDPDADRRAIVMWPPQEQEPDPASILLNRLLDDILARSRLAARAQDTSTAASHPPEDSAATSNAVVTPQEEQAAQSPMSRWQAVITASNLQSTADFVEVIAAYVRPVTVLLSMHQRRLNLLNTLARAQSSLEDKLNEHQYAWANVNHRAFPNYPDSFPYSEGQRKMRLLWDDWATQALALRKVYVEFEESADEATVMAEAERREEVAAGQRVLGRKLDEWRVEVGLTRDMVREQWESEV